MAMLLASPPPRTSICFCLIRLLPADDGRRFDLDDSSLLYTFRSLFKVPAGLLFSDLMIPADEGRRVGILTSERGCQQEGHRPPNPKRRVGRFAIRLFLFYYYKISYGRSRLLQLGRYCTASVRSGSTVVRTYSTTVVLTVLLSGASMADIVAELSVFCDDEEFQGRLEEFCGSKAHQSAKQ